MFVRQFFSTANSNFITSTQSHLKDAKLRATLLTLLISSFSQLALAQRFNPSEVAISSISMNGNGCPAGSARAVLAPDASSLTVLFDQLQARSNSVMPVDRKNCSLVIQMSKPKLWSFAIESADFRGFVSLSAGSQATQKVSVNVGRLGAPQLTASFAEQRWVGPLATPFLISSARPIDGPKLLSCFPFGRDTKVAIESTLTARAAQGGEALLDVDSFDGKLVQKYNLKWINCISAAGDIFRRFGGAQGQGGGSSGNPGDIIGGIIGGIFGR
jgi:hypothetical protein